VEIYKHLFKESLINDDRLKLSKVLLRFARISEKRHEVEYVESNSLPNLSSSASSPVVIAQERA